MPATVTIVRPVLTDSDTLSAAQFDLVAITSATVPDADGATLGVVKVAGDLAGTAAAPAVAADAVTFAKMQNIATDKLIGRATAATGDPEEIPCTAAGRAMIAAVTAAAQRTLLSIEDLAKGVTAQFNKTNATLADITGLSVNLVAGSTYSFEAHLCVTQDTTGLSKVAMSGSATASAVVYDVVSSEPSGLFVKYLGRATALGTSAATTATQTTTFYKVNGTIAVTADGTLTVQFAQAGASGTSSVLVGSYLRAWKHN